MNKRLSRTSGLRERRAVGFGGTHIKSNSGRQIARQCRQYVGLGLWKKNEGRAMNGMRTSSAILRRSKPRNGALRGEKAEDRPLSNTSKKSTLSTGNKIKSRIPTTHCGRNGMQGDSMSHPTYEETSSGISSNNSARRPSTKTLSMLPSRKPTNAVPAEKRQLEIQYSSKRMRYTNLKKTLVDKQVTIDRH
ncbi:hypothetical protein DBV15_10807 [Temnothorax longispinosus]|uniref:Uncharacterized protein n=1 Tax=Temnothorax longispinosus TaxID=300112 RepID=A0A4S2KBS9_9HYME|nr:hypothetical protein DBV15_10807 [Temnothorax longispinosus]